MIKCCSLVPNAGVAGPKVILSGKTVSYPPSCTKLLFVNFNVKLYILHREIKPINTRNEKPLSLNTDC